MGIINTLQILISIVLVIVILLQVRETGTGLFGSAQASFRTRRGLEKTFFQFTIFLAFSFLVLSVISARVG